MMLARISCSKSLYHQRCSSRRLLFRLPVGAIQNCQPRIRGCREPILITATTTANPSFLSIQALFASNSDNQSESTSSSVFTNWKDGPPTCFGTGTIANLAKSSVVGTCGHTVVLVTLATNNDDNKNNNNNDPNNNSNVDSNSSSPFVTAMKRHTRTSDFVPLKVDVQHRYHGVGKIPTNSPSRRDNRAATPEDILASRAVDRALRPLIQNADDTELHVQCGIQSCHLFSSTTTTTTTINNEKKSNTMNQATTTTAPSLSRFGHPVALCLNAASVALALQGYLKQHVACVCVALLSDGTVVVDPTRAEWEEKGVVELLIAGTRNDIVMMEVSTRTNSSSNNSNNNNNRASQHTNSKTSPRALDQVVGFPEESLTQLMALGHAALQPLLDAQEEFCMIQNRVNSDRNSFDDDAIRASLGLPAAALSKQTNSTVTDYSYAAALDTFCQRLLQHATVFCNTSLENATLSLFGNHASSNNMRYKGFQNTGVHASYNKSQLLPKALRGRREHVVYLEIERLLQEEFVPTLLPPAMQQEYDHVKSVLIPLLARTIHDQLLREALFRATYHHGTRGDGRMGSNGNRAAGWKTVRPISVTVPALPDVVHGSAIFERGETQVLCTVTLGAPREGMPQTHPYLQTSDPKHVPPPTPSPFSDLPVGSLRYIRTQEALISDLNSRKVIAEREMTGDSGTLGEVRRAFLHYDFPAYSTGTVGGGSGGAAAAANRRAIGHGALAERAVLPTLPPAHQFPYAIRINSEVTSSNGSSSMATVCGATLALMDAGVPIREPVAGVSIGLTLQQESISPTGLLLDITGTEDHYGYMDFKIAGTRDGVTALQLDVKRPLPLEILEEALELAREGRRAILDQMAILSDASSQGILQNLSHRPALKESAPRVEVVRFDPVRKRDLIGPGGAVLRQLEDRYGVSLDLTQEGQCLLYGANREMVAEAKTAVMDLVSDVEVGGVYEGTVIALMDFGAIIELLRNKEGLLHVSEMGADLDGEQSGSGGGSGNKSQYHHGPLSIVKQHLQVGQKIEVLCTDVDPVQGVIKLSRKAFLLQKRNAAM